MPTHTQQIYYVRPNYHIPCENCGQTPTVDLIPEGQTEPVLHMRLCGVCCWGEAELADPDKW